MLKKSFLSISFVGVGNVFNAALGFLFITAAAKTLPVSDFGRYALLSSLLVSLSKLMDFGTNSLFVAKSITSEQDILDKFFFLRLVLFIIALPVSLLVIYFLHLATPAILMLFVIGFIAYGINQTLFALFQKLEKFHFAILLNTIPAVIKGVLAALIFLKVVDLDLTRAFAVFSLTIISSIFLIPLLPKELRTFRLTRPSIFPFFKKAFPAGISLLINEGWLTISDTVAKITRTFTDVGIFSLANKIADIFSLASLSIFTVLLPKNAARKKEDLAYDLKETFLWSGILLVLAVAAIFTAKVFIQIVFGDKFAGSIGLLNILIFASALTAIHKFMDNYFFVEEQTKFLLFITTSKLTVFLILSFILIPALSLRGLALANLLAAVSALTITLSAILINIKKVS